MRHWRVLDSREIVKDRWLHLYADKCETGSGVVADPYYVIQEGDWVTAAALTPNKELLLIRQYRHPVRRVVVELPGGRVDPTDENAEAAAVRELLEETGYQGERSIFLGAHDANPARFSNKTFAYLVIDALPVSSPVSEHGEEIEVFTRPLTEVLGDLNRGALDFQPIHLVALYRMQDWLRTHS